MQVEQRNAVGMKDLQAKGAKIGEKLDHAKGMVREAEKQWPGLKNYLNVTGLGSDPRLVK